MSQHGLPAPLVVSTRFTSTALAAHEQFDAWRERMSAIFSVEPLENSSEGFIAEALAYHLGDLILVRTRFDAQRFVRTKQRARSDMLDHYLVQFYNEGGYIGEVDGESIVIRAGSVSVLDLSRTVQTRALAAECVSLVVPRDVMHQLVPHTVNLHGAVLDSGNGRLLSTYLVSLLRQLPTTKEIQVPHVTRATCHLLAACFSGEFERSQPPKREPCSGKRPASSGFLLLPGPSIEPSSKHDQLDDWIRALRT